MRRWQYAILSNPASGTDGVAFSHSQSATLVPEASADLGRGLKPEQSSPAFLHLNLNHTTPIQVSGMLGDHGWELAGYSTLTGGHEYWIFKKEREPEASA